MTDKATRPTSNTTDRATGHYELATRIERFLDDLDRDGKGPTREATYHLVTAISRIESNEFEEGHRAMDKAEREARLPPEAADMVESHQDFDTHQLRAVFHNALNAPK